MWYLFIYSQGSHHLKSPWMSLNFEIKIQGLENPWKLQSVLEGPWVLVLTLSNLDSQVRRTQRQFSQNICSENDLRSRIFRNIRCKISCLPTSPRIFKHQKNGIMAHFKRIFTLKRSPITFGSLFSGWNFRKGNFRINRLSASLSEQMKNFRG